MINGFIIEALKFMLGKNSRKPWYKTFAEEN